MVVAVAAASEVRRRGGGRKPAFDANGLVALRSCIEANGKMTLDELAAAFTARTGKVVSKATVAKGMKALGYRKVKVEKAPSAPARRRRRGIPPSTAASPRRPRTRRR